MATTSNKKLYSKFVDREVPLRKDKNVDSMYESLFNGKNSYLRMSKRGSSYFDSSWIEVIEDCLYELGEIVNNPREVTVTDSNVTPIELAKKVDGVSVQHLASHTQYIKEIDEHGDVIPSKILSHSNIDDIHTYENRFIATFIRRLMLFVNKRYEFIRSTVNLTQDDVLYIKNKTIIDDQEVEIESKITIKKKLKDQSAIDAQDYINRILLMREYIQYYYSSPFMKQMKNEKDVRKPILQTNIIRKNPKYRKCFETFTFIERFDSLGVSYHIDENYQTFNEEERGKINYLLLNSYLAVQDDEEFQSIKKSNKVYKPKILTSIDDEEFVYGDILKGPIEFVRIDEKYRQYLDSKVRKDLPAHPNKYEKEFFKEEYDYKKERKLDNKELDALIARKQKEAERYEKLIQKLIEERNIEEAEAKRRELEAIRAYENELLEIRRQRIIEAALKDKEKMEPVVPNERRIKRRKNELLDELNEKDVAFEDRDTSGSLNENKEEAPNEENAATSNVEVAPAEVIQAEENAPEAVIVEENKEEPSNNEAEVAVVENSEDSSSEAEPTHVLVEDSGETIEAAIGAGVIVGEAASENENNEEVSSLEENQDNNEPQEEVILDSLPEGEVIEEDHSNEEIIDEDSDELSGIVYHVVGEGETVYVDGHKEERFIINDEAESFVIKTDKGYYSGEDRFVSHMDDALIYQDEEYANEVASQIGGEVIKL